VAPRGPGDFFGEISMVDRGKETATVTAATDSTLLVMSHQQFRDAVMAEDDVLAPVLRAIQLRMPDAELNPRLELQARRRQLLSRDAQSFTGVNRLDAKVV
jgi:CRP-like cAMP-binding protein